MKNKGFTLIELLAVIIVLGIVAIIAVPTVSKIVDDSKKNSFKITIKNIVEAVENECQTFRLKEEEIQTEYKFTNSGVLPSINIKGILPIGGSLLVDSECNVKVNNLSDGKNIAIKDYKSDEIEIYNMKLGLPLIDNVYDEANNWPVSKDFSVEVTSDGYVVLNGTPVTGDFFGITNKILSVSGSSKFTPDGNIIYSKGTNVRIKVEKISGTMTQGSNLLNVCGRGNESNSAIICNKVSDSTDLITIEKLDNISEDIYLFYIYAKARCEFNNFKIKITIEGN